jgi:hypothetical protein
MYNELNDHQKHQCAGFKGSAHAKKATAAAAVAEGTFEVSHQTLMIGVK